MNKLIFPFSFILVLIIHYFILVAYKNTTKINEFVPSTKIISLQLAQIEKPKEILKEITKEKIIKKITPTKQKVERKIAPIQKIEERVIVKNIIKEKTIQKEIYEQKTEIATPIIEKPKETIQTENEEMFEKTYIKKLREAIDKNKSYPTISKKLNEQGRVTISFRVLNTGIFEKIEISRSSGKKRLDKAALEALFITKSFKPFTNDIKKEYLDFNLPLEFRLN